MLNCNKDALKKPKKPRIPSKSNYKEIFFEKYPEAKGKVFVHHAVEQNILKGKTIGSFIGEEIHSLENLRGIPNELNRELHLSKIRIAWNEFHEKFKDKDKGKDKGKVPTRQQILDRKNEIDDMYGHLFNPPIR